jgi:hypothetical protein
MFAGDVLASILGADLGNGLFSFVPLASLFGVVPVPQLFVVAPTATGSFQGFLVFAGVAADP